MKNFAVETWDLVKYATFNKENPRLKTGHVWANNDGKYLGIIEMCKALVLDDPTYWSQMKAFTAVLQPTESFGYTEYDTSRFKSLVAGTRLAQNQQHRRLQILKKMKSICIVPGQDAVNV